jgi:hypothetical protein
MLLAASSKPIGDHMKIKTKVRAGGCRGGGNKAE